MILGNKKFRIAASFLFAILLFFPNLARAEEENSGKIVSNVNKKLNYLVIGEKPTSKKIKKAKELNIKILTQNEWVKMLNKTS